MKEGTALVLFMLTVIVLGFGLLFWIDYEHTNALTECFKTHSARDCTELYR